MRNFLEEVDPSWVKKIVRSKPSRETPEVSLSVVVPTFNRDRLVTKCLDTIFNRHGFAIDDFEVLVVDDGSEDKTSEQVSNFIQRHPGYRITLLVLSKNVGPSIARNIGILHARGEFVAFTDDDCIVPQNWLARFNREFRRHPEIHGVGGWKKPALFDGKNPSRYDQYFFLRRLEYMRRGFKSKELHPYNNCGDTANVCYRKDSLFAVGGFDPRFRVMEDWELKIRMHEASFTLLYIPTFVEHSVNSNFNRYILDLLELGKECSTIFTLHPEANLFRFTFMDAIRKMGMDIKNVGTRTSIVSVLLLSALTEAVLWYGARTSKARIN